MQLKQLAFQTVLLHCCHKTLLCSIFNSRFTTAIVIRMRSHNLTCNELYFRSQGHSCRWEVSPQKILFTYWIFIQITYNRCVTLPNTHTHTPNTPKCLYDICKHTLMLCTHAEAGWSTPTVCMKIHTFELLQNVCIKSVMLKLEQQQQKSIIKGIILTLNYTWMSHIQSHWTAINSNIQQFKQLRRVTYSYYNYNS